jgi:pimeloyl-ACP methyl ester carboxylesterase
LGPLALNLPFFINILPIPILGPVAAISLMPGYARFYARRKVREALIKTARLIDAEQLAPYGQALKTIRTPTLVIWGRKDRVVPLKFGKRLVRDLPNSRLIVIDDCGHVPHQECPDEVIAAVKEFVQRTSDDVSPTLLTRKTNHGEMGHDRDRNDEQGWRDKRN